jgi:hypothetical protein
MLNDVSSDNTSGYSMSFVYVAQGVEGQEVTVFAPL